MHGTAPPRLDQAGRVGPGEHRRPLELEPARQLAERPYIGAHGRAVARHDFAMLWRRPPHSHAASQRGRDYRPLGHDAQVDDLDRSRKELGAKGVKFEGDVMEVPGVVRIASFRDPAGNRLQLCQVLMQQ